jgi:hypothetical protein
VSLLVDSSKSRKAPVAAAGLMETEVDKTLYYWSCGYACHSKKDCPKSEAKPVVPPRISRRVRESITQAIDLFSLWAQQSRGGELLRSPSRKCPSSDREKTLETKIDALEERFKSLVSSGQILDVPPGSC